MLITTPPSIIKFRVPLLPNAMPKVESPFLPAKVDTSDPDGSVISWVEGGAAVALTLGIFALGRFMWNWFADNTPDQIQPVEVL